MSYGYMGAANEALFDAEQTTEALLDAIRTNVNSNVNSIDAAAALENKLSEQAASFNQCLTTMANAYRKCEAGEITREQAMDECKPCVDALKSHCEALNLSGVSVGSGDITEEEIAMLREVITGAKDIVAARKRELEDCPINSVASEGFMSSLYGMDPATESAATTVLGSPEKKSADQLYKSAKKLYGLGQQDKAVEYMTKAKKLYEKCAATAKKNSKWYTAERTVVTAAGNDKFKKQVTDNRGAAMAIHYLEDRADACQAWLMKWSNRAGNADYQDLKNRLKEERKAERQAHKEAKKAAKHSGATEGYIVTGDPVYDAAMEEYFDALDEFEDACESLMDSYETELALAAAMESDGAETPDDAPQSPSGLGARLRAAFSKLKKAKASGDDAAAKAAAEEVKDAAQDLQDEANSAEPEKKKGLSTAAKVGLAAAGAAAAVAGLTVAGQALKKNAESNNTNPNQAAKLLINASNQILNAKNTAVNAGKAGAQYVGDQYYGGKEVRRQNREAKDEATRQRGREGISRNIQRGMASAQKKRENADRNAMYKANMQKRREAGENRVSAFMNRKKLDISTDSWDISDLLANMAMEANIGDIMEEEVRVQPQTGKAFDDTDMQGDEMIEGAEEGADCEDCEDLATEAFIAEMTAEDGFGDD